MSNHHSPSPYSPHQSQTTSSPENYTLTLATENPSTQKALPSHPMITRSKAGIFKSKLYQIFTQNHNSLPKNTTEALKEPKWTQAMEDKYNALMKNKTWTLIPNN